MHLLCQQNRVSFTSTAVDGYRDQLFFYKSENLQSLQCIAIKQLHC